MQILGNQEIDNKQKLLDLKFTEQEILIANNITNYLVSINYKITAQHIVQCGYSYEQAYRIKYMYDIATGKIVIESKQDFIKHLKKMFGSHRKISIYDLPVSKLENIPRIALVGGIDDKVFSVLNSNLYPVVNRVYYVNSIKQEFIQIKSEREIVIPYGYPKEISGVLKLVGKDKKGRDVIDINKEYCRLCCRYIIVASMRRPEIHMGLNEIICIDGSILFVYAKDIGTKDKNSYYSGTSRVYTYGYRIDDVKESILKIAEIIYKKLRGVRSSYEEPIYEFNILREEIDNADMNNDNYIE